MNHFTDKNCIECKAQFRGANKSSRCQPCQAKTRSERRKVWNRTYRTKNSIRHTDWARAYQRTRRAIDPIWRENEKTKYHKRRALIEGNGGVHTTAEWLELVAANDNQCAHCHEECPLTRDHIVPLSRGGTNDIKNIQPLCGSCNSSKGAKLIYA